MTKIEYIMARQQFTEELLINSIATKSYEELRELQDYYATSLETLYTQAKKEGLIP